jgi:hypothetical protein
VVLDRWRPEDVELIRSVGNRKFNQQWQQRVARILEGPYGEEFQAHFASAAEHQYCHLGPDASPYATIPSSPSRVRACHACRG